MTKPPEDGPKILLYDVEMSLNVSYHYDQWKINIPWQNIKHRQFMICASWQWYGQKAITSVSVLDNKSRFRKDHRDDYHVIKALAAAVDQANATVAYNGARFDEKELNTGVVKHGLPPLSDHAVLDPYQMARSRFRFKGGNSLANLCDFFDVAERKGKVELEDWIAATEGDPKAIRRVIAYNRDDIPPMAAIWTKLRPFVPAKINMNHFVDEDVSGGVCPACASASIVKNGVKYTRVTSRQQWQCKDCRHQFLGKKAISTVDLR